MQAVGCRAALIFGEKSALVSRETASYMSSLMGPRAPVVEVPEARHHVMLDQPLGFVAALRMLLDSWMRSESAEGSGKISSVGTGSILRELSLFPFPFAEEKPAPAGGTGSSNPLCSTGESGANSTPRLRQPASPDTG